MDRIRSTLLALVLHPTGQHDLALTAAEALAEGLDSPALREVAGLPLRDDDGTRSLFLVAAEELGLPVPSAGTQGRRRIELAHDREWSTRDQAAAYPAVRALLGAEALLPLERAFARVERDLRKTLRPDGRLQPVPVDNTGELLFFVGLGDGASWSGGRAVSFHTTETQLLVQVADCLSETVLEVWREQWPVCRQHDRPPADAHECGGEPVWWCSKGQHVLARIGQLTADVLLPRP
ncbi:hypothetical protein EV189_0100 [Motilibacter rhizosphaerae]|uniref:Uncharacterized protein n=1 Tax=Motilibacter rhizosphaerae TaxID=598652 RepID=A0A4Q7NV92_9ACTN|nr:hypothetical protein [Motilibacter rhizosphaerae]RZS90870.1 hypothetical protein EV189_0100 [Motilibacter rhizosphaerae]